MSPNLIKSTIDTEVPGELIFLIGVDGVVSPEEFEAMGDDYSSEDYLVLLVPAERTNDWTLEVVDRNGKVKYQIMTHLLELLKQLQEVSNEDIEFLTEL